MRIHCMQHVAFEGIGSIRDWAMHNGHTVAISALYEGAAMPAVEEFDWLVVMGGPMGVHDTARYPWLHGEKRCIERVLAQEKTVVGICLGAQLLADVLGARVERNKEKEIGWFPLHITEQGKALGLFPAGESNPTAFHWHGDTFAIPRGAVHLAASAACEHQAFLYGNHALGLQFHAEVAVDDLRNMIPHGRHELVPSAYVQTEAEMYSGAVAHTATCTTLLYHVLDALAQGVSLPRAHS